MLAAVVPAVGEAPELREVDEPEAAPGERAVDVVVAGLNPVDLSMASGSFHGGAPEPPYVAGREGVARVDGGRQAYFERAASGHGSMAPRTVVAEQALIPLPDGLDAGLALCLGIAGLAGWLALEWRARLAEGETVLVLGASGTVGTIAVQAARLLGAARVVAAARDRDGLERARRIGADATVDLRGEPSPKAIRAAAESDIDVVVDPLWGAPAVAAIEAAARGARIVQLGQSAGAAATLASATVRGKELSILGHFNAGVPPEVRRAAYERMAEHAARGEIECEVERLPLERIGEAWERQAASPGRKLVLVP